MFRFTTSEISLETRKSTTKERNLKRFSKGQWWRNSTREQLNQHLEFWSFYKAVRIECAPTEIHRVKFSISVTICFWSASGGMCNNFFRALLPNRSGGLKEGESLSEKKQKFGKHRCVLEESYCSFRKLVSATPHREFNVTSRVIFQSHTPQLVINIPLASVSIRESNKINFNFVARRFLCVLWINYQKRTFTFVYVGNYI